jgi:hypothetical protein
MPPYSVIPSAARELGVCLHQHAYWDRHEPKSLASLGMTILSHEIDFCALDRIDKRRAVIRSFARLTPYPAAR